MTAILFFMAHLLLFLARLLVLELLALGRLLDLLYLHELDQPRGLVQLAALLHDVDDRKLSPATHENLTNAGEFLLSNGVNEEDIKRICQIIREVSFGANGGKAPSTLEGKCVQDADRLDAIGAMGIARAFAYGGSHGRHMYHPDIKPNLNMTSEEYRKSESTTINHFYEKLFKLRGLLNTDAARKIATEREEYMKVFVAEFMDEWEGHK